VPTVRYNELEEAFAFVSFGPPMDHAAFISLDTGTIYCTSESMPLDEEVPDDLKTSDRYIAIPHKNELDLGKSLVLRFVAQELPDKAEQVGGFFRGKGAYARFKDLLQSLGIVETWYAFEAAAAERALRDWCAEYDIEIVEQSDVPSA
jgi:hypothetical protein